MSRCLVPGRRIRQAATALLLAALGAVLAGCAPGNELVRRGQQLIDQGQPDQGLAELERAVRAEPDNASHRMLLIRQRERRIGELWVQFDTALQQERWEVAEGQLRRLDELDPRHPRLSAGRDELRQARRQRELLDDARALQARGDRAAAQQRLRLVLAESPRHPRALDLERQWQAATPAAAGDARSSAEDGGPRLRAALGKPVSIEFRDANLRTVFQALSRSTGLNFVFDREVRQDIKVTLFVTNIGVEDVVSVLTVTNQLGHKVLNDNTVLIFPNTPAKQKDYAELVVRTFYLANADAKSVFAMLKTVLKSRDLHADERLNLITLRDTPAAVRLAERLIASQDVADPEVLLEVEVLEVKRSRLSEIGLEPPGQFTVLNIVRNPSTVVSTATGATTVVDNTLTTTQLTLDRLRGLSSSSVGIANPSLNLRGENGDTSILANPRIRVKNRDKARILIGDRVPVITTTSTANVGVSESVSYLEVGLKLDVEPTVYLDDEVGVKISLEVSNLVKEVRSKSGGLTYQIGTRLASTSLRLKDGETQALAGLISDEDRRSAVGLPGLNELPVVGRLFSSERNDHSKTEIVLLITPRVVRNLTAGAAQRLEFASGTENAVGAPALRMTGTGRMAASSSGGAGAAAAPPANVPAAEPEPEPPAASPAPPPVPAPSPAASDAAGPPTPRPP